MVYVLDKIVTKWSEHGGMKTNAFGKTNTKKSEDGGIGKISLGKIKARKSTKRIEQIAMDKINTKKPKIVTWKMASAKLTAKNKR